MRVAISGKGGAGKTTISATLARLLAREGYSVTAIDGDPNPNLGVALGLSKEELGRLQRVPSDVLAESEDAQGNYQVELVKPLAEIQHDYAVRGPDGVTVLLMAGLKGSGAG
ncbi:MAG: AAA family ATPase [Dehalococcoidia bacterium]